MVRLNGGDIPVIETARLILRPHRVNDFNACFAMWSDPAVVRHISGKPSTREEVWSRLTRYIGHWSLMGFGFWAITEKEGGVLIGETGFADFRRNIAPPMDGKPEMGWVLSAAMHGKGYAIEATSAARDWGAAHFGPIETVCIISPDNAPSIRVAEKLGFREMARTEYHGDPTIMYRMTLGGAG